MILYNDYNEKCKNANKNKRNRQDFKPICEKIEDFRR